MYLNRILTTVHSLSFNFENTKFCHKFSKRIGKTKECQNKRQIYDIHKIGKRVRVFNFRIYIRNLKILAC